MRGVKPVLLAAAAFLCLAGTAPVFAQSRSNQGYNPPGRGGVRGAPGPLAGAGLPFLIAAGAIGAYRLVRRRRNENSEMHDKAELQ